MTEGIAIDRFTLQFEDISLENGFVKGQFEEKLEFFVALPLFYSAILVARCVHKLVFDTQPEGAESFFAACWQEIISILCCLLVLACVVFAKKRPVTTCQSAFLWEKCFAVATCSFLFFSAFSDNLDSSDEDCDSTEILVITVMVISVQYILPVRWCFQVGNSFLAVILYGVSTRLASGNKASDSRFHELAYLSFVCLSSTFYQRQAEISQRKCFAMLVRERKLRAIAEFQLSVQESSPDHRPDNNEEETDSLPTTTDTGRVFSSVPSSDVGKFFAQLLEIGEREHWLIDWNALRITDRRIGEGSFGIVVVGSLFGTPVALKCPRGDGRFAKVKEISNELRIHRTVRHPNIVLLHGACIQASTSTLFLVMELIQGVCLNKFILDAGPFSLLPSCCDLIIVDICRALRYLHEQSPSIVHGDLKPTNIMVESGTYRSRAKLLDFGLARLLTRTAKPLGGTSRWMSPELLLSTLRPHSSCDVFSLGRIIYFVSVRKYPFQHLEPKRIVHLTKRGTLPQLDWHDLEATFTRQRHLSERCQHADPATRPQMEEVLEMVQLWVRDADSTEVSDTLCLSHPNFEETPAKIRHFMVAELAARWNVRTVACCPYHSFVQVLLGHCRELFQAPCRQGVPDPTLNQCPSCKVLTQEDEDACEACGRKLVKRHSL